MKSFIATVPLLAATVSAHTTFQSLWVNGVPQGKMTTSNIRHDWSTGDSNFPLTDVTNANIACNKYAAKAASRKATVPAGAKVTAEWHHEPTQRSGDNDEPIALSHKGPIMAYLGKVDDSATASVNGVEWFKIFENVKNSTGHWAVEQFYENKGLIDFTIPSCVANGDYFLRVEIIGLHEADRANGAQLYPECAQITITGGGTANPPTVNFPGAYTQNGQGLSYNLYSGNAPYTAPGPSVFTCGAGNAPAPPPQQPTVAPTTAAPTTAAPVPTTSTGPAAPAPNPTTSSAAAPIPSTLSTSTRRTRSRRPTSSVAPSATVPVGPVTTASEVPAPSSTAPSTPGGAPTRTEIESFFSQIMELYNTWKAGA